MVTASLARTLLRQLLKQSSPLFTSAWSAMSSSPPFTLRDSPLFRAIFTEEVRTLRDVFARHGHELRLAGGAVRDILGGKEPKDLDFATPATPEEMKSMFTSEGIRMIHELGESHGTITARINDADNFEVTTLRVDRVTDGRHAQVEFTTDWLLDAGRRDLTVNSMFLGLDDGALYDYFGGREDLERGRVAFVGEADTRIKEDYLRILRYFRFFGRIAKPGTEHEEEPTLKAIRENAAGLAGISGERIWSEWKKILAGNLGGELTLKMVELGLAEHIGLPAEPNCEEFRTVYERSQKLGVILHPVTLLSGLLKTEEEMMNLHGRLKLSGFERDLGLFIIAHRRMEGDSLKTYQDLVADLHKHNHAQEWTVETLKYRGLAELAASLEAWTLPRMPVTGKDLMEAGCPKSKLMSGFLNGLREKWKESGFAATKEELLEALPAVIDDVKAGKVEDAPALRSQFLGKRKRKMST